MRTFKLIEQYDEFIKFKSKCKNLPISLVEDYEVTLLINYLFGTLCLPKNKWFKRLEDPDSLKLEKVKSDTDIELFHLESGEITFDKLIKSMRNGICHWEENKK